MGDKCEKKNITMIKLPTQSSAIIAGMCSLLEQQSLTDVAILCENITWRAHKVFLAAVSPYLREQLEMAPNTEQIVMNGIDTTTMRNVLEYMYSGQATMLSKNKHFFLAVGKKFQLTGLVQLASLDNTTVDSFKIPAPTFSSKKIRMDPSAVAYVSPYNYNSRNVKKAKNRIDQEVDKVASKDHEPSCTTTTVENDIPTNDKPDLLSSNRYIPIDTIIEENQRNNGKSSDRKNDIDTQEVDKAVILWPGNTMDSIEPSRAVTMESYNDKEVDINELNNGQNSVVNISHIPTDMIAEENQSINSLFPNDDIFSMEGELLMGIDQEMSVVDTDHRPDANEQLVSPENFSLDVAVGDTNNFWEEYFNYVDL